MRPMQRHAGDIALVEMPWTILERPLASFGLITATLEAAGLAPRILFADFWMSELAGKQIYSSMSSGEGWTLMPEFAFSKVAYPEHFAEPTGELIATFPEPMKATLRHVFGDQFVEVLAKIRDHDAPALCERVVAECSATRIAAFTCTINQLSASLAAARLLKARLPGIKILLGGAQVEGEMGDEVLRVAPWVDAVYKGEAELGVVDTVLYLLGELEAPPQEYVSYRDGGGELHVAPGGAIVRDMDSLPVPVYDQYFEQVARSKGTASEISCKGIPFVSSRGCWWGEIEHCTFCGLNGLGMAYRSKRAEVVYDELVTLSRRYGQLRMVSMDNIIPAEYLKTLLPRIRDSQLDFEILYETKSNLKRQDVKLYREAGLKCVQPGIESFSDNTLRLMRKGVTGIQNVFTLKLAAQYGVVMQWNILCGFPGERPEDYSEQIDLMRHLHHLQPPSGCIWFGLQRFSPFHFESGKVGVENVRALKSYKYVYPPGLGDIQKLAFYFSFDYAGGHGIPDELKVQLRAACRNWTRRSKRSGQRAVLAYLRGPGFIEVRDTRRSEGGVTHTLTGLEMELFAACDDIASLRTIKESFGDTPATEAALDALRKLGLIMCDGKRILNLALPASTKGAHSIVKAPLPQRGHSDSDEERREQEAEDIGQRRDLALLEAVRSKSQLY